MVGNRNWTRRELLLALRLYCRLPFGRLHRANPEVVRFAEAMGRSPSALAMKLVNFASLDPKITDTGRSGLPNASALDRQVWDAMQSDWSRFAVESEQAAVEMGAADDDSGVVEDEDAATRAGEDRVALTTARVGQRFFRSTVLSAYDGRCCITGLAESALLVASHVVPWSQDEENRVNPRNGLLLSSLHDKAFDAGIITIADDLTVRVSERRLREADGFFASAIGAYDGRAIRLPHKFEPDRAFLRHHREHIFEAG